jgi:hypothetical protein
VSICTKNPGMRGIRQVESEWEGNQICSHMSGATQGKGWLEVLRLNLVSGIQYSCRLRKREK